MDQDEENRPYLTYDELRARLLYLNDTLEIVWRKIPMLLGFEDIPFGTLYDIAHGKEPSDPILRERLHLEPRETCKQCWRFNRYVKEAVPPLPKRWDSLSKERLLFALENREPFITRNLPRT